MVFWIERVPADISQWNITVAAIPQSNKEQCFADPYLPDTEAFKVAVIPTDIDSALCVSFIENYLLERLSFGS
jgi:hypothetical protein